MRTTTPLLLLALPLLTAATTLTPLLAVRYLPQSILVNHALLSSPCSAYSSTDIACGALCLPSTYTCCPDKLGGCAEGDGCVKGDNGVYGCCAEGGKCSGDGKVVSGVSTTGTATTTATATESKTTTGESSTKTDAETTADAGPTTTGDAPADATPTPTGGAVAYAPGSAGAVGAAVVAMLVL